MGGTERIGLDMDIMWGASIWEIILTLSLRVARLIQKQCGIRSQVIALTRTSPTRLTRVLPRSQAATLEANKMEALPRREQGIVHTPSNQQEKFQSMSSWGSVLQVRDGRT